MNRKFLLVFFTLSLLISANIFSQAKNFHQSEISKYPKWASKEIIIYRPDNKDSLNEVRCWIKILDEEGTDVTYSKTKAGYAWGNNKHVLYPYEKSFYLKGGMAMHLWLWEGNYKIYFYTTPEEQKLYNWTSQNHLPQTGEDWKSNEFLLNTKNMSNVLWVSPTANDNGFFNGGWYLSYKAPQFYKWTKPVHIVN